MLANLSDRAKGGLLAATLLVLGLGLAAFLLLPRAAPAGAGANGMRPHADEARKAAHAPSGPEPAPTDESPPTAPQTARLPAPPSTEMTLTVPALDRVDDVRVKTAHGSQSGPLRYGAMHVLGTGYPWQEHANTYIAGHRLGFPGTPSDRLFWDLDDLRNGDRVFLTDADERRYEYRVFREKVVDPLDISVAQPVAGKDVVSLQTCTLPDYEKRLVVQAELVRGPSPATKGAKDAEHPARKAFGVTG